jgi:hypothetical protein
MVGTKRFVLSANSICALLAAVGVIECGSSTSDASAITGSGAADPAHPAMLTRFLVRAGEEPGFTPRSPHLVGSVRAWVRGEPSRQATVDTKRYKAEGFVAAAFEHTTPKGGYDGISNVIEFSTSTGARREMTHLMRSVGGATKFRAAGIPGARGAKGKMPGGSYANLVWVEGRCTLLVGESVPRATAPTAALSAAAQAIYRRTAGRCP